MRLPLCIAAVVVALVIAGCGSDSGSSTSAGDQPSTTGTTRQPTRTVLHYITREERPRNPGPHPGARVDRLIIRDVRVGQGPAIQAGDSAIFEFIASDWVTGRTLEESWHRRRPYETRIERGVVIDGWWQGIPGMRTGGRRQIIIPPSLGFTDRPELANATTFFEVVLVEIRPQQPAGLSERAPAAG